MIITEGVMNDDFITKEIEDMECESDNEADHFDAICDICDNPGLVIWYYLSSHVVIALNNPLGRLKLVYSWICELDVAIRRVAFSVTLIKNCRKIDNVTSELKALSDVYFLFSALKDRVHLCKSQCADFVKYCDGKCFRSFHATRESEGAQDSNCDSLCLSLEEVKETEKDNRLYKCENCRYNLHQCFACGELGSSDNSSNTEVFQCSDATCCHFYHPKCVAKLLQKENEAEPQALEKKIAGGILSLVLLTNVLSVNKQKMKSACYEGITKVRQIMRKISSWWNIDYSDVNSYEEWQVWLVSIRIQSKLKGVLEGVYYGLWWYMWNFRNKLLFDKKIPEKALIFDNLVSSSFYWCKFRCKASFKWDDWLKNPYIVLV
ncbi:hypothetical protein Tco_0586980 [Tanacetum coccineum]